MVILHGKEFALTDLPQICWCGNWNCSGSFKGKEGVIEEMQKAREEAGK